MLEILYFLGGNQRFIDDLSIEIHQKFLPYICRGGIGLDVREFIEARS